MFGPIHHQIHDGGPWREKVNAMASPPASLRRHQFLTSPDLTEAACLLKTTSIEELRGYIDPSLGPASAQSYFQVYEECGIELPS